MSFDIPDPKSAENYRLLVEVLEDTINTKERDLLRDAPYQIQVHGLTPPAHNNDKHDRIRLELAAEELILYEDLQPQSTTISLTYPSPDGYPALDSFEQRWTNDISWVYAHLNDGPIGYASQSDHIIGEVQRFTIDDSDYYLESIGLDPAPLADREIVPEHLEELMSSLMNGAHDTRFRREREVPIDAKTSLRTVHEARVINTNGEVHPVQELRLEVTHFNDMMDHHQTLRVLDLPTTFPIFENHIVFVRDDSESKWKYQASYEGTVAPGWLIGEEYEKDVSSLTLPELSVFAKVLGALEDSKN